MRIKKRILFSSVFIILIFFFLTTFELPYYIYKPGHADALTDMIEIENGYKSEGKMHLVTVSGGQATPIQYFLAKMLSFHEITPVEEARPKGMSDEEYMHHQLKMMENSHDSSKVVAYQAANREVKIEFNGVYVINVVNNMPAKGKVEVGDRIVKVDERKITEASDLVNYVQEKQPGDLIEIEIDRDGNMITKKVEVTSFPDDDEKVGIGIQLVTDQKVTVDPEVQINSGNIGGPSAGIMFALEMYDQLVKDDITKGYQVAGTGEIDFKGNVYRIGGVDKKVVAAHRRGIDIFFVPNENGKKDSNYSVAKKTAEQIETDMEIVPIDSFSEALMYLEQLEPK